MSEGVFKSTVFGGFDKKDVLNYIENIEKEVQKDKDELKDRFELINNEKERMASEFFALQEQNHTLEKQLGEGNIIFEDLKIRNRELANESIQFKTAVSDKDIKIRELLEEIENIDKENEIVNVSYEEDISILKIKLAKKEKEAEDYKVKSDRFDKLNKNIDGILSQTKKQTQFLIEKAYRDTKASSKGIEQTLADSVLKMEYFKKEVQNLRNYIEGVNLDFINQLGDMDRAVNYSINEIDVDGSKLTTDVLNTIEDLLKNDDFSDASSVESIEKIEDTIHVREKEKDNFEIGLKGLKMQIEDAKDVSKENDIYFPIKPDSFKIKNSRIVKEEPEVIEEKQREEQKDEKQLKKERSPEEIIEHKNPSESIFEDINFFSGNSEN